MFIVGRAVAGIGGAGISTGSISIVAIVSLPKQRGLLTGILFSLFSVGLVVGPVIGGALTHNVSWRWCFYINLPSGAVIIGILAFLLHPPRKTHTEPASLGQRIRLLDLFGCFLFAGSMIMLFLAMQWGGGEYPWKSATVIGLFVGSGLTVSLFLIWEKRQGDKAMIPFSLLRRRSLSMCILFIGILGGASVIPIYYLPEWFQIIKGVGPTASGVRMLPFVGFQLFAMIIVGASSECFALHRHGRPLTIFRWKDEVPQPVHVPGNGPPMYRCRSVHHTHCIFNDCVSFGNISTNPGPGHRLFVLDTYHPSSHYPKRQAGRYPTRNLSCPICSILR